jgi:hypothetical protein
MMVLRVKTSNGWLRREEDGILGLCQPIPHQKLSQHLSNLKVRKVNRYFRRIAGRVSDPNIKIWALNIAIVIKTGTI